MNEVLFSLVYVRAIPTFLRVAGWYDQTTVVAHPVRQIDPELSEIAHPLTYFLHQFLQNRTIRVTILRWFLIEV